MKRFRAAELCGGTVSNLGILLYLCISAYLQSVPALRDLILVSGVCYLVPAATGTLILLKATEAHEFRRHPDKATTTTSSRSWAVVTHSIALFVVRQADIILVASITTNEVTGFYAGASRLCSVLTHPLSVVNSVVSPYIASMHDSLLRARLQDILSLTATAAAIPAIVGSLTYAWFPSFVLANSLGDAYAQGFRILQVLAIGQLINAISGSCGITLLMTGNQRLLAAISTFTAVLTIVAGLGLGRAYGAVGVAIAFTAGTAVQNLSMWAFTLLRTGLRTELNIRTSARVLRAQSLA
jgi:O-antigen/teichoic acid export membrane protein